MAQLIRSNDLKKDTTEWLLKLDDDASIVDDINRVQAVTDTFNIDVTYINDYEAVAQSLTTETVQKCRIIIRQDICNSDVLKQLKRVTHIEPDHSDFILTLGDVESPAVYDQLEVMQHNLKVRSRTYETVLVESYFKRNDAEDESASYQALKQENARLKSLVEAGMSESQSEKYVNLMEKYKQALTRLDHLRNSKLGKLQMKYWSLKRRR